MNCLHQAFAQQIIRVIRAIRVQSKEKLRVSASLRSKEIEPRTLIGEMQATHSSTLLKQA